MVPKSVLCVEAQAEIQDALRKNLSEMGYRVHACRRCRTQPPSDTANRRSTPSSSTPTAKDAESIEASSTCMKRHRRTVINLSHWSCSGQQERSGKNSQRRQAHRVDQADQDEAGPGGISPGCLPEQVIRSTRQGRECFL